jgi:oligopeptide transport system substrate-binding protein
MAIDREAITDKVLKTGELPAYSFVPPGTGNYGDPAYVSWMDMPYAERVAEAKSLLAEAGYGPDKPLRFTLSYNTSENHKRIAIAAASMWKKELGVEAELFNQEVTPHYNKLEQNDFDVARAAWIADYNDAQNFLYLMETRTGRQNYGRWSNAEYDGLMERASTTTDMDERAALMREAEAIAMEEQANIPIYYYVSKNLVSPQVKGWEPNAKDIQRTRYLSLEP